MKDKFKLKLKNICVFCGACNEVDQKYKDLAARLGELIGINGYSLVYGGSARGMMGVLSNSTQKAGGNVIGIFPKGLEKVEMLNNDVNEMIFVDHISYRKQEMIDKSDMFIVLPGGFGTLDEFFEVITLKNILDESMQNKQIIIINYNNYWDSLIQLLNNIFNNNFANKKNIKNYIVFNDISDKIFDLNN